MPQTELTDNRSRIGGVLNGAMFMVIIGIASLVAGAWAYATSQSGKIHHQAEFPYQLLAIVLVLVGIGFLAAAA